MASQMDRPLSFPSESRTQGRKRKTPARFPVLSFPPDSKPWSPTKGLISYNNARLGSPSPPHRVTLPWTQAQTQTSLRQGAVWNPGRGERKGAKPANKFHTPFPSSTQDPGPLRFTEFPTCCEEREEDVKPYLSAVSPSPFILSPRWITFRFPNSNLRLQHTHACTSIRSPTNSNVQTHRGHRSSARPETKNEDSNSANRFLNRRRYHCFLK